jgi:hypothetical protein
VTDRTALPLVVDEIPPGEAAAPCVMAPAGCDHPGVLVFTMARVGIVSCSCHSAKVFAEFFGTRSDDPRCRGHLRAVP